MQRPACDFLKKLEEDIKELNHLIYTVIERDSEVQEFQKLSYGRHYEQLQDQQDAQILTQENLLSKSQRVEVANVLLRQETSRFSRGSKDKDNMMLQYQTAR